MPELLMVSMPVNVALVPADPALMTPPVLLVRTLTPLVPNEAATKPEPALSAADQVPELVNAFAWFDRKTCPVNVPALMIWSEPVVTVERIARSESLGAAMVPPTLLVIVEVPAFVVAIAMTGFAALPMPTMIPVFVSVFEPVPV